jgi:hypothetical protein
MILPALALLLAAQNPVVMTHEPRAASPWVHSVRANCGRNILTLEGYGGGRPLDMMPRLRVNGRPVTGAAIRQLLADLSHKRAVYRLQILCGAGGEITLRIGEGEKQENGPVRYRSGAASFLGNRLRAYTGFEEVDADAFWFR